MADKTGVAAVLDEIPADRLRPALADAEQLALLPDDVQRYRRIEEARRAGPGRPKGAKNRRTADFADFILHQYRSPLIVMAETYSRPVGDLARELGCPKEEAFKLQLAAARELAPYVHQKQPIAVNVDNRGVVQLVIESALPGGTTARLEDGGEVVIDAAALPLPPREGLEEENEENQELINIGLGQSDK